MSAMTASYEHNIAFSQLPAFCLPVLYALGRAGNAYYKSAGGAATSLLLLRRCCAHPPGFRVEQSTILVPTVLLNKQIPALIFDRAGEAAVNGGETRAVRRHFSAHSWPNLALTCREFPPYIGHRARRMQIEVNGADVNKGPYAKLWISYECCVGKSPLHLSYES